MLGKALLVIDEQTPLGHLAPGLDGHTLFTGLIGRLNTDLRPSRRRRLGRSERRLWSACHPPTPAIF